MPSLVSRSIRILHRAGHPVGLSVGFLALASCLVWMTGRVSAQGSEEIPFYKHTIDLGQSEAAEVADVNQDGRLGIISGENWYEQTTPGKDGPRWIKHHFRDLPFTGGYLEDLGDLAIDVNGDGYPDVVTSSYWSTPLAWWENPGKSNRPWVKHVIETRSPVEFSFLVDILNTGKERQLLPQFGDTKFPLTWYEIVGKGADAHWVGHVVSPRSYGHGIGAGDVNGDGRTDIITPKGWFEAPPDPRNGEWIFHPEFDLGDTGFIYTMGANGERMQETGYEKAIELNQAFLARAFGASESMVSCDTLQFSDYSAIDQDRFDVAAKAAQRERQFPRDCAQAYAMGAGLVP